MLIYFQSCSLATYSHCWSGSAVIRANIKVFPTSGLLLDSNRKINYDMQVLSWISVCHVMPIIGIFAKNLVQTVFVKSQLEFSTFCSILSIKALKMTIPDLNYYVWCIILPQWISPEGVTTLRGRTPTSDSEINYGITKMRTDFLN